MDKCKICDSELINKEQVLRARMKDNDGRPLADQVIYKAWCPNCEIYLRKTTQGNQGSDWETSHIKQNELKNEISEIDLQKLKSEIESKPELEDTFQTKKRWNEFISMIKKTDKLYSYIQNDSTHTIEGYVIKRNSFLISFFVYEIKNNIA